MGTTATKTNGSSTKQAVGLFPVAYKIGGNMPGAPLFMVHLTVNTPDRRVNGYGTITQTTNPPLSLNTKLDGDFTYMTVMPNDTHILMVLTGYPVINWPPHAGIGPVIMPNVELRMVLSDDWKSGVANYRYQDNNGNWHEINDAPVVMA